MPVTLRGSGQVIVQIVSASTSTTTTTTSTTYVDTTLSANITPDSASNKILVVAYCPYIATGASGYGEAYGIIGLHRSSTVIEEQQVGYNIVGNTAVKFIPQAWSVSLVDSPATTSAVNYNIKIRVPISNFTMQFRYPDVYASSPINNNPRITLMEISG